MKTKNGVFFSFSFFGVDAINPSAFFVKCAWVIVFAIGLSGLPAAALSDDAWKTLAPGLELGSFALASEDGSGHVPLTILRVDPKHWEFDLLTQRELQIPNGLTAKQWCKDHQLVAAINAGMFATDRLTHLGYLKRGDEVHNNHVNKYQSVAAFGARQPGLSAFRIFDLDRAGTSVRAIASDYSHVVQNLRLIKKPGENRWSAQNKRWSEAALGEDQLGRALLIFSRGPFSMHVLNQRLLGLGIDLVAAQHLEGGPEAQLFVQFGETTFEGFGSFETGFMNNDGNPFPWPIPNVIAVRARQ